MNRDFEIKQLVWAFRSGIMSEAAFEEELSRLELETGAQGPAASSPAARLAEETMDQSVKPCSTSWTNCMQLRWLNAGAREKVGGMPRYLEFCASCHGLTRQVTAQWRLRSPSRRLIRASSPSAMTAAAGRSDRTLHRRPRRREGVRPA